VALQHVHRHSCCGKKKRKEEEEAHHHHKENEESSSSSEDEDEVDTTYDWMDELERKKQHPRRLHPELWFNEPAQLNDGPICRCSLKARRAGIRHLAYPGEEELNLDKCHRHTNNGDKLYHYRIKIMPHTNFLLKVDFQDLADVVEGGLMLPSIFLQNCILTYPQILTR
jgi:ribonuclease-3